MTTIGDSYFTSMTVSGTTLYAATAADVSVYDNVLTAPALAQTYCLRPNMKLLLNRGLAVDPATLRLFVSQTANGLHAPKPRIAIWTLGVTRCPSDVERVITASPTANDHFAPLGIAFSGTSLFAADDANAAVYQLDAHRGKQAPLATMTGVRNPSIVVLGP